MMDQVHKYTIIAAGNLTTWVFASLDYVISIVVGIFTLVYIIKQIRLTNLKRVNEQAEKDDREKES